MKKLFLYLAVAIIAFMPLSVHAGDWIDGVRFSEFELAGWRGIAEPSVSNSGRARVYFDSTTNKLRLSENTGAYSDIVTEASGDGLYVRRDGTTALSANWSAGSYIIDTAKIGVGTATVPHAGVGWGILALDGVGASADGPHVQFTTTTDNHPLYQMLHFAHDNIHDMYDAYWDGSQIVSGDVGSNFQFKKNQDKIQCNYSSGNAQGASFSFTTGWTLDTAGTFAVPGKGTFGTNNFVEIGKDSTNQAIVGSSAGGIVFSIGDDAAGKGFTVTEGTRIVDLVKSGCGIGVTSGIDNFVVNLVTNSEAGFFDDGVSNGVQIANGTYGLSINEGTFTVDYSGNLISPATGRFDSGLLDSSDNLSVEPNNRILTDESGNFAIDFTTNRFLADASGITSLDWGNRQLSDDSGVLAIEYTGSDRFLRDSSSSSSLDYGSRILVAGGSDDILDWSTIGLAQFGDSAITTTDIITVGGDTDTDQLIIKGTTGTDITFFTGTAFTGGFEFSGGSRVTEQTVARGGVDRMLYLLNGSRIDFLNEGGSTWETFIYLGSTRHRGDGANFASTYGTASGGAGDVQTYFDTLDWIFESRNQTANDEVIFRNFDAYNFDNTIITSSDIECDNLTLGGASTPTPAFASTGFIAWPNGSLLLEQTSGTGGTERMLYTPNGSRIDITNEAGSNFQSTIWAGNFNHTGDGVNFSSKYGAAQDALINFTNADLKIQSNAGLSTDGLILQQQNIAISSTGATPPSSTYPVTLFMDATSTRGLFIDGDTNPVTTDLSTWAMYLSRTYAITDGSNAPAMDLGEFRVKDNSTNAILGASKEHIPLRFFYDRDATAVLTNNSADNRNNFVYGMFARIDDDGTYDTSSTGNFDQDMRGFYTNILGAPTLTDTSGNGQANTYLATAFRANINATATVGSGNWSRTQVGFEVDITSGGDNNYGLRINTVSGATNNYGIWDNSGTAWRLDNDSAEIQIGETGDELVLKTDGTNGNFETAGVFDFNSQILCDTRFTVDSVNAGETVLILNGDHSGGIWSNIRNDVQTWTVGMAGDESYIWRNTTGGGDPFVISKDATNTALSFLSTETVMNNGGVDLNFRVEGDTEEKLLLVDAGLDVVRMGDGDTNYTQFAVDGFQTMVGTAQAWVCADLSPMSVKSPGTNPPADDTIDEFPFQRYDRATEESVYFIWHIPCDYAEGTANVRGFYEFVVENPPVTPDGDEAVVMGFEWKKLTHGDVFSFVAGTTTGTITETISEDETALIIHQTGYGTLDTTGWAADDTVLFRFFRDATNVNDTYDNEAIPADNDVWIKTYHIEYKVGSLGTAT